MKSGSPPRQRTLRPLVISWLLAGITSAYAQADMVDLPLEQLMQMQVTTASRYAQTALEAPAAVSVVTAEDIRLLGYRSLAEVLASMRGLYVSYDRAYHYLGTRGFATPGDYNTRVLLLVNGVRLNDNLYDQANIGTDFPIDLDLIERVEFVSGPGSAVYGANAFFGVVNVITRDGHQLPGAPGGGGSGQPGQCQGAPVGGHRGCLRRRLAGGSHPGHAPGRRPLLPKLRRPQQQPRRGPGAGL